jgi:hypothetical protein
MPGNTPATLLDITSLRELVTQRFNCLEDLEKQRQASMEITRVQIEKRLDEHNHDRVLFLTRDEYHVNHTSLVKDNASLSKLVYIGFGVLLVFQIIFAGMVSAVAGLMVYVFTRPPHV